MLVAAGAVLLSGPEERTASKASSSLEHRSICPAFACANKELAIGQGCCLAFFFLLFFFHEVVKRDLVWW